MAAVLAAFVPAASADVFTNVTEANGDGWQLIYTLVVPPTLSANWNANAIPYLVNNSAGITSFDRVAYYMELTGSTTTGYGNGWVYVSFDRLTGMTSATKIGVPNTASGEFYQQDVANMNVFAGGDFSSSVTTGTGIQTGNIEFWPSNYSQTNSRPVTNASGSAFDFGDGGATTGAGHGSMQIHNYDIDGAGSGTAGETLFSFNKWGNASGSAPLDIGIGTNPNSMTNRDWTSTGSAPKWTARTIQVLVHVPEPGSAALLMAGGIFCLTHRRRRRRSPGV